MNIKLPPNLRLAGHVVPVEDGFSWTIAIGELGAPNCELMPAPAGAVFATKERAKRDLIEVAKDVSLKWEMKLKGAVTGEYFDLETGEKKNWFYTLQ